MMTVLQGDTFEVLPAFAVTNEPFHGIVTDPPYGLGSWDWIGHQDQLHAWHMEWAEKALDVVYPGAHMAVFSGTRHFHHMMLAVEAAGWELRDTLLWMKAGGMPKSRNRGPYGTGLKPGWEPIALFRKPLAGTIFATFDKYETGMLHIDATRIPTTDKLGGGNEQPNRKMRRADDPFKSPWMDRPEDLKRHAEQVRKNVKKAEELGRWPANVILDIDAAMELNLQSGITKSNSGKPLTKNFDGSGKNRNAYGKMGQIEDKGHHGDEGGTSRFFYIAKVMPGEREAGLIGHIPCQSCGKLDTEHHMIKGQKSKCHRNSHPTVKPIKLLQYLNRMLVVPGGRILDPFAGTGSDGAAAALDGFDFTGIERDEASVAIANARIEYWAGVPGE